MSLETKTVFVVKGSFDFQSLMQVSKTNMFSMKGAPDNNNSVELSDCPSLSSSKSFLLYACILLI